MQRFFFVFFLGNKKKDKDKNHKDKNRQHDRVDTCAITSLT